MYPILLWAIPQVGRQEFLDSFLESDCFEDVKAFNILLLQCFWRGFEGFWLFYAITVSCLMGNELAVQFQNLQTLKRVLCWALASLPIVTELPVWIWRPSCSQPDVIPSGWLGSKHQLTRYPSFTLGDKLTVEFQKPQTRKRVLCWALCHTSHSYSPTSFRSKHHVVLCWLVECMMSWVWIQNSNTYIICLVWLRPLSVTIHEHVLLPTLFEGSVQNPLVLLLCCYASGREPNMAATFRAFCARYDCFVTFWLAEAAWVIGCLEILYRPGASFSYLHIQSDTDLFTKLNGLGVEGGLKGLLLCNLLIHSLMGHVFICPWQGCDSGDVCIISRPGISWEGSIKL